VGNEIQTFNLLVLPNTQADGELNAFSYDVGKPTGEEQHCNDANQLHVKLGARAFVRDSHALSSKNPQGGRGENCSEQCSHNAFNTMHRKDIQCVIRGGSALFCMVCGVG